MSDYLSRMSMSKDDSFEKFYVVCQTIQQKSQWIFLGILFAPILMREI